ncbi:MAG: autotransporter domain-containing protein [Pseudomonadota bacterium]
MRLNMNKLAAAVLLLSGATGAHAQIFKVTLSGANENPPVTTNGSGSAIVAFNTTTHELRVSARFLGLTGNTTASHIHCCVAPTANGGVATTTPTFVGFPIGVTAGSWDNTYNMTAAGTWNAAFVTANGGTTAGAEAALLAGALSGQSYLNIHSSFAAGGEIRGTLLRHSFVSATPARSAGLGAALDALGAGTGALSDRLVGLAMLDTAGQRSALDLLLPASSAAVQTVTSNTLFTEFDQIGSRMEGLRISDSAPTSGGFWIKAIGIDSQQDAEQGFAGFDDNAWDGAIGYDRVLGTDFVVGVSVGLAEHSLGFSDQLAGSSTDIETTQATLYATKTLGNAYIDGMVSIGQHDTDFVRNAGAAGMAKGTADSDQLGARVAAGLNMEIAAGMTLTPQVKLDWVSLDLDGYREFGGSGLALNVDSQSLDRLRSSLGAQLDWGTGTGVMPFVRGFWNYDWKDDSVVQTAAFAAGGASFTDVGPDTDSSSYSVGAGINFRGGNGFSAAIAYDFLANDSFESNMLHAKLLWTF